MRTVCTILQADALPLKIAKDCRLGHQVFIDKAEQAYRLGRLASEDITSTLTCKTKSLSFIVTSEEV